MAPCFPPRSCVDLGVGVGGRRFKHAKTVELQKAPIIFELLLFPYKSYLKQGLFNESAQQYIILIHFLRNRVIFQHSLS